MACFAMTPSRRNPFCGCLVAGEVSFLPSLRDLIPFWGCISGLKSWDSPFKGKRCDPKRGGGSYKASEVYAV